MVSKAKKFEFARSPIFIEFRFFVIMDCDFFEANYDSGSEFFVVTKYIVTLAGVETKLVELYE